MGLYISLWVFIQSTSNFGTMILRYCSVMLWLLIIHSCSSGFIQDFVDHYVDRCRLNDVSLHGRLWPSVEAILRVLYGPWKSFKCYMTIQIKWNESGFRPPLCTYRLNWARRTSWGWWDDWDDTVLQTQDSKFEPWRSEAEHATSRSRRLPTILTFTRGWGRNNFVSFKPPRPGTEPRTLAWKAAVLTTTLGPPPTWQFK